MQRRTSSRKRPSGSSTDDTPTTSTSLKKLSKRSPSLPRGVYSHALRGKRPYMEDCHSFTPIAHPTGLLVGVFDGHGGVQCSSYCADELCAKLSRRRELFDDPALAMNEVFTELDKEFCATQGACGAGSTVTALFLRRKQDAWVLTAGNAGDSSAVVIRGGEVMKLTKMHHGSNLEEQARIEKLGGEVTFDEVDQIYRVGGILAVSRSIGDAYLKPFVCATPDCVEVQVEDSDIIVVGSDGLWDETSDAVLVKTIRELGIQQGIKKLVANAAKKGDDNVTAVVINVQEFIAG